MAWLTRSVLALGYETDIRTTRRLAEVIAKRYGIRFNANYLAEWLIRRGYSTQKPEVRAVERDNLAIARLAAED